MTAAPYTLTPDWRGSPFRRVLVADRHVAIIGPFDGHWQIRALDGYGRISSPAIELGYRVLPDDEGARDAAIVEWLGLWEGVGR